MTKKEINTGDENKNFRNAFLLKNCIFNSDDNCFPRIISWRNKKIEIFRLENISSQSYKLELSSIYGKKLKLVHLK